MPPLSPALGALLAVSRVIVLNSATSRQKRKVDRTKGGRRFLPMPEGRGLCATHQMNTILIFATQAMLSLLSFGLIAGWVIYPRLRERSLLDALTPLLLFETLRTIGLIVLVPGLVDAALPAGFALPAAVGHLLAVVMAFAALIAVRPAWSLPPSRLWLSTRAGLADFINATRHGARFPIPTNNQLC